MDCVRVRRAHICDPACFYEASLPDTGIICLSVLAERYHDAEKHRVASLSFLLATKKCMLFE